MRSTALCLFDATLPFHELGPACRDLLPLASELYPAHLPHAHKKTTRAARRLVSRQAPQLDAARQATLAAALVLARKLIKRKHLPRFDLSPVQQRQVLTLAALLRIAGAIHQPAGTAVLEEVLPVEGGIWLVVSGLDSAAAAGIQRSARLWDKIGYPPCEVIDPEEARQRRLPFPQPAERIGLQPDDPLSEAARKVLCYHFARVLQHEPGTRQGEDIEALHDMRVATRRLRAAFEVFADAFEPGYLKPYLKGLRATGRALGKVRDLDVFMQKAQRYLDGLPIAQTNPLAPLLDHWQAQREQARAEMLAYLDSPAYAAFKHQFNRFLHTPGAGARFPLETQPVVIGRSGLPELIPVRVRELAPVLIYSRLAAVRAYATYLKDADVLQPGYIEHLHALRIEFKKLRYTVEYFQEALGSQAGQVITAIKHLQDHLGDLNDAQVAATLLSDFLQQAELQQARSADACAELHSLEGVAAYLASRQAERQRLLQTFYATWREHFANARFRRSLAGAVSTL